MSPCIAPPSNAPTSSNDRDEELLQLVRQGDPAAFAELYERHHRMLRRYVASLAPVNEADDIVAEAFMATLRAINRGNGPLDNPVRYLMVAARSKVATFYEHQAKATEVVSRLASEPMPEHVDLSADPWLEEAFRTLSPRWRQVIWWSEIEDLSPAEVGEQLGVSPRAASALAYRARNALRAAYEELTRVPDDPSAFPAGA